MSDAQRSDVRPLTELIDSAELAERLHIAPRTLDQWAYRGVGPKFIKLGAKIRRYRVQDVEAWLNAHTEGGAAA